MIMVIKIIIPAKPNTTCLIISDNNDNDCPNTRDKLEVSLLPPGNNNNYDYDDYVDST